MLKTVHRAATRGHAVSDGIDSWRTFSFADYYNPRRMHFGALRMLNDDTLAAGEGYALRMQDNTEIVLLPLEGRLRYEDDLGQKTVLMPGQLQAISAGAGIAFELRNDSADHPLRLLRIGILPGRLNLPPRSQTVSFAPSERNLPRPVVAPEGAAPHGIGRLRRRVRLHTLSLTAGAEALYPVQHIADGVYVFVLSGNVSVEGERLSSRDGMGVWETDLVRLHAPESTDLLLLEVPMAGHKA